MNRGAATSIFLLGASFAFSAASPFGKHSCMSLLVKTSELQSSEFLFFTAVPILECLTTVAEDSLSLFAKQMSLTESLFSLLGYSRKNPHPPPTDGMIFLTPPPPGFPGPLDTPSRPDFQVQRPPLPPGLPLISLEGLILIEIQWKGRKITFRRCFCYF